MAIYLFASRLSSVIWSRKTPAKSDVRRHHCRRLSPDPPTTAVEPRPVNGSCLRDTDGGDTLQRNARTRVSVGVCGRSHGCAGLPKSQRRVRFANTFPRVNRKKRLTDVYEEGEIVEQKEEEEIPVTKRLSKNVFQELVFRDSNLVSGTLEALIQRLVPTADHYPDRAFLFAFLLSSRLFIRPNLLLGQVIFHFYSAQARTQDRTDPTASLIIRLLAEWMETFPYDFRDERMMTHIRSVIRKCASCAGTEEVSAILQSLLDRLTDLERYEKFLQRLSEREQDNTEISKSDMKKLCSKPEVLAQQLTTIELEHLSYIGPEEFLQSWDRPARHLEAYESWTVRLASLVPTEILRHKKRRGRVRTLQLWISTAQHCLSINNFNSLIAILSGLSHPGVKRLSKTWSGRDREQVVQLESRMSASGNFSSYKEILQSVSRKLTSTPEFNGGVLIPYFSLFLKDVAVLTEACSRKLPNGHVNFEKFWQMAKLVTELMTWKQVSWPPSKQLDLNLYLQSSPLYDEKEMIYASFLCESPTSVEEREQWRSLAPAK